MGTDSNFDGPPAGKTRGTIRPTRPREDQPPVPVKGLTRPVHENLIVWRDTAHLFSDDEIGVQIRVWLDTTDLVVKPRVQRAMLDAILLNYLDLSAFNEVEINADHARELCMMIAALLKRHSLSPNAVEFTVGGMGSLYYPEWP